MSDVRNRRLAIGASILEVMEAKKELPLPNIRRLSKVMMEFYNAEDFVEAMPKGCTWEPTAAYWMNNLDGVRAMLRRDGKYFEYVREQGEWKGLWAFTTKTQYEATLRREYASISSLTDNYNGRLKDGQERWKLPLPAIKELPKLAVSTN